MVLVRVIEVVIVVVLLFIVEVLLVAAVFLSPCCCCRLLLSANCFHCMLPLFAACGTCSSSYSSSSSANRVRLSQQQPARFVMQALLFNPCSNCNCPRSVSLMFRDKVIAVATDFSHLLSVKFPDIPSCVKRTILPAMLNANFRQISWFRDSLTNSHGSMSCNTTDHCAWNSPGKWSTSFSDSRESDDVEFKPSKIVLYTQKHISGNSAESRCKMFVATATTLTRSITKTLPGQLQLQHGVNSTACITKRAGYC